MTVNHDYLKNEAWKFISVQAYSDAFFLAELLNSENPTEDSVLLLVTIHFHLGKFKVVKSLFEKYDFTSPKLCLLYVQSCIKLQKYPDAERILARSNLRNKSLSSIITNIKLKFKEWSSHALSALATIYIETEQKEKAEKCLSEALFSNPLMWTAFDKLCKFTTPKSKPNPEEYFKRAAFLHHQTESAKAIATSTPQTDVNKKKNTATNVLMPIQVGPNRETVDPPHVTTSITSECTNKFINSTSLHKSGVSGFEDHPVKIDLGRMESSPIDSTIYKSTEDWDMSIVASASDTSHHVDRQQTRTQKRIANSLLLNSSVGSYGIDISGVSPLVDTPESGNGIAFPIVVSTPTDTIRPSLPKIVSKKMVTRQARKATDKPKTLANCKLSFTSTPGSSEPTVTTRRSSRIAGSHKENTKKTTRPKLFSPREVIKKSNRLKKNEEESTTSLSFDETNLRSKKCTFASFSSIDTVMSVICQIGRATVSMSRYDCKEAISLLEQLPESYLNTPTVLNLIARAYFEINDYRKAKNIFEEIRSKHPYYLKGMAIYSSCLWKLNDQISLSTLASDLHELDPMSTETWCVIGNCFSLQRDNLSAIKFFSRAVQQDPAYPYARTLLGHEYCIVEDTDRAMSAYQSATRYDPTHYSAWYGMGMLLYRQESFDLAEKYFDIAISINGSNATLFCHKAMTQYARKQSQSALKTLKLALKLEPHNPLCMFNRASILFGIDRLDESLEALQELKKLVPKESVVYFLIGKVSRSSSSVN